MGLQWGWAGAALGEGWGGLKGRVVSYGIKSGHRGLLLPMISYCLLRYHQKLALQP